jgi:iron complex transport system substrate-binding protein
MQRLAVFTLTVICLVSLVAGCQPKNQPVTLTDDAGRSVSFDTVPQRIISHVPSITEMLFTLGLGDRVVGVDDYSDYPPEAKQKPSVGNYYNPSIENIVALNPDLVLTDGYSDSIKQLDNLGIRYLVINPKDIEGIFRDLRLLGQVAGIETQAAQLIDNMNKQINDVMTRVKNSPKVTVFYVLDARSDPSNPWTAGPGSFIDSLITMAGGDNIAGSAPGAWVQFSIEEVVAADPQIIILASNHGTADVSKAELSQYPVWSKLSAVKKDNIFTFNADLANPVPRITQGLQDMAKIIHPEAFQ